MTQVLWFDPGGQTGFAVWNSNPPENGVTWELGTIRDKPHHAGVRMLIDTRLRRRDAYGNLTVGTESFEFRKSPNSAKRREGLELVSKEYIGVMELVCYDHGLRLEQQSPSILSGGLVTNDHLAALGLLPEAPLQAKKDQIAATRHLVHYLLNTVRGDIRKYIIDKYKEADL